MAFEVGLCTQNNSETILMSFFLVALVLLVLVSMLRKIVWMGVLSSTGLLFSSLFIVGCIAIFAYLIAGFALVSIIFFVVMKPNI